MKILREGIILGDFKLQGECESCHCVVEYNRSELQQDNIPRHDPDALAYVCCPTRGCGKPIALNRKRIL